MNKNDVYKVVITILAIVATLAVILVTASILAPRERSSKAEKVDLSCVTEPSKNPLKDCTKAKEYALECGPQYVKLPKDKCEIKEQ